MGNDSKPSSFTPSLKLEHADARGEIYSIELPDGEELMLLHSKAGIFRGGHSHSCDEVVVLLSGEMRYHKRFGHRDVTPLMQGGDVAHNYAGEVHMGEFLTDSWVVEYKLGTHKGGWTQSNYEPMRERVRASAS